MAYWLFQGNPKYYRIIDAIRDFEQMPWLVTRYGKEIMPGDGVLGKESRGKSRSLIKRSLSVRNVVILMTLTGKLLEILKLGVLPNWD